MGNQTLYLLSAFSFQLLAFSLLTKHFDLDVVVHVVGRVAVAVEADILAFDAVDGNRAAFERLDIVAVFADAQAGGIVMVIVENRLHIHDEIWIVRRLDHDVAIDTGL